MAMTNKMTSKMTDKTLTESDFPPLGGTVQKSAATVTPWSTNKTKAIIEKTRDAVQSVPKEKEKAKERSFLQKYQDELILKEFSEREEKRREMDRVDGDRDYRLYGREIEQARYRYWSWEEEYAYAHRRYKLYQVWTGHGYLDETTGQVCILR